MKRKYSKLSETQKNGKPAGIDGVINAYIKNSVTKLLPVYVYVFNKILKCGKIPRSWTVGAIIPKNKQKGDIKDPSSYRGITLLSCIGKVLTSILNERLTKFLETNKILSKNQAGFRKRYPTNDHIFLFKCIIDLFLHSKQKIFCAFIDYQKAFDTVWREGLWNKLSLSGITKN